MGPARHQLFWSRAARPVDRAGTLFNIGSFYRAGSSLYTLFEPGIHRRRVKISRSSRTAVTQPGFHQRSIGAGSDRRPAVLERNLGEYTPRLERSGTSPGGAFIRHMAIQHQPSATRDQRATTSAHAPRIKRHSRGPLRLDTGLWLLDDGRRLLGLHLGQHDGIDDPGPQEGRRAGRAAMAAVARGRSGGQT